MGIRVAHLGLGKMGYGIADNIRSGGFDITVWNRSPEQAQEFVSGGGRLAATPAEAVAEADVVTSCLFDDASLMSVLEGPSGVLAGLPPGAVHVSTTTVSPAAIEQAARLHTDHGSMLVCGTVLGRPDKAASGQLGTFLAGPKAAIDACADVVRAYCKDVVIVGEQPAQSAALKLAINGSLLGAIELISEMTALAESYDVPAQLITDGIVRILADGPTAGYATRIQQRDFEPAGFTMAGGLKDADLVLSAATSRGASTPLIYIARDRILTALSLGWQQKDWSAISDLSRMSARSTNP